jgi:hypothetical protein
LHVGGKGPNADVTLRDADGKTSIKNIQWKEYHLLSNNIK